MSLMPMRRHCRFRYLAALILAWLSLAATSAARAESPAAVDALPMMWSHVEYSANKFFLTAYVDVDLSVQPAAGVESALLAAPGHVALAAGDGHVVVSTISTKVLGQNTTLQLWSRPTMQALQRTSFYTGRKYWYRLFRYADAGVYSLKRRPAEGQNERAVNEWKERNEDFYPYAPEAKDRVLVEPEVLFYHLATREVSASMPEFELYTADRGQLLRVTVSAAGTRSFDYPYVMSSKAGDKRNEEAVEAVKLRMHVTPASAHAGTGDFKFLGLSGDIELLVDPVRRLIVELRGDADPVGEVRFLLRRVVLAAAAN